MSFKNKVAQAVRSVREKVFRPSTEVRGDVVKGEQVEANAKKEEKKGVK